ncbi:hypothetical protein QET40_06265 [Akkermansia sp. N21169]|nr:hypothetical protein [Akkermansia sp. N21169]
MIDLAKRFFIIFILLFAIAISDAAVTVYSWKYTPEGAHINATGWDMTFTYKPGDDYASFGAGTIPFHTKLTDFPANFTVSFDVKSLSCANSNGKTLLSLYSNNNYYSSDTHSLQLQFNDQGKLYFYNMINGAVSFGGEETGNVKFIDTGLTSQDLQSDKWIKFCIVSDLSAHTLSIYVNGSMAGSITNWNPKHPALTGAQFGQAFGKVHTMSGTIKINNVNFYNDAVPPGSLFADMPLMPEFSKMFHSRSDILRNKYIASLQKIQQKYVKKQDFATVTLIQNIVKSPDSPVKEEKLPREVLRLATAYTIQKEQQGEQIKKAYLKTILQQQAQYAQKKQFDKTVEIQKIIKTIEDTEPSLLFFKTPSKEDSAVPNKR